MSYSVSKLNVVVIGSGPIALEHVRAFKATKKANILAIVSRKLDNARRLAQQENVSKYSTCLSEVVAQNKLDLAVVAVSIDSTFNVVDQLISLNVPMLVEKPLGMNIGENNVLVEKLKKCPITAFVAMNRRSYQSTRRGLEILKQDSGTRYVDISDQQAPALLPVEKFPSVVQQHWMFANSVHLLDYAFIFGRGNVDTCLVTSKWKGIADVSVVNAEIGFDSGDVINYRCKWNMPGPWSCAVTTKSQRIELRPLEKLSHQRLGSKNINSVRLGGLEQRFKAGFYFQALDVIRSIQGEHPASTVPSWSENQRVMKLMQQIYAR